MKARDVDEEDKYELRVVQFIKEVPPNPGYGKVVDGSKWMYLIAMSKDDSEERKKSSTMEFLLADLEDHYGRAPEKQKPLLRICKVNSKNEIMGISDWTYDRLLEFGRNHPAMTKSIR